MLRSMTGFGAASGEGAGVATQAEARSVNHRHLQLKLRLPSELSALEPKIDAAVRKRLGRGAVTVSITLTWLDGAVTAIDLDAAARYQGELARLARKLDLEDTLDLSALLALPGVVAPQAARVPSTRQVKLVMATVEEALDALIEMREREGGALLRDLSRNGSTLSKTVAKIGKRMPRVVRDAQAGLKQRVETLLDGARVPEADLAREIALIADRSDVSEELSRLASHIDQIENRLGSGDGSVGRELDFLVQELFRELNTLGAKCGDAQVAHWVVEAKTLVERLREQVQNVE